MAYTGGGRRIWEQEKMIWFDLLVDFRMGLAWVLVFYQLSWLFAFLLIDYYPFLSSSLSMWLDI
jgi:hypothetical protein